MTGDVMVAEEGVPVWTVRREVAEIRERGATVRVIILHSLTKIILYTKRLYGALLYMLE